MTKTQNSKRYDLEDRTLRFAQGTIAFVNGVPGTLANAEVAKQRVRSAGSVGANYIEANESLSKKDFIVRIKICRKEAKESAYWLKLAAANGEAAQEVKTSLIQEATELTKIFGAMPSWRDPNDVLNFVL